MQLSTLFWHCLHANYIHIGEGADYAIERRGRTLYIYLQHSRGLEDWKNNLDFPARAYKREGDSPVWYVHRGFLRVWKSIEDTLAPAVAAPGVGGIVTVGYSHGAALGVLCHEYIWYHRPDLRAHIAGYGFGCPRVVWRPPAAIRVRWDTFTVIRNREDIVTHLPPALLGYAHVGELLAIGARGRYSAVDAHRPENIEKELFAYETSRPAPALRKKHAKNR